MVGLPEAITKPQVFKVWPENEAAFLMFVRLLTQWRMGPRGPIGLDYGAAQWLFSLYKVEDPVALIEDLQIMEATYLAEVMS